MADISCLPNTVHGSSFYPLSLQLRVEMLLTKDTLNKYLYYKHPLGFFFQPVHMYMMDMPVGMYVSVGR